jgi:hypothetical protein
MRFLIELFKTPKPNFGFLAKVSSKTSPHLSCKLQIMTGSEESGGLLREIIII